MSLRSQKRTCRLCRTKKNTKLVSVFVIIKNANNTVRYQFTNRICIELVKLIACFGKIAKQFEIQYIHLGLIASVGTHYARYTVTNGNYIVDENIILVAATSMIFIQLLS